MHGLEIDCCTGIAVRDYRAENAGIDLSDIRASNKADDTAHLFLPSAKDYQSAKDPDGEKGMRQWREDHSPRPDNPRPRWPQTKKELF